MSDKFSLYQTDGLWGIIENASNEKQTSIKSYFGSDLIIKRLNEQAKQIDQLKQQLAEKDKEINSLIVDYEKRISQEQELMSNMEHRLTEKQNTIDEINKEFVQSVKDWKTLCAERDKEIAHLKEMDNYHLLYELAGADETIANLKKQLEEKDKDKTQLAIQELEKVKELVKDKSAWQSPFGLLKIQESDVEQIIDQQIKELKGEKDVKD